MQELVLQDTGLVIAESFFKPVKVDNIKQLVEQYDVYKKRIKKVSDIMHSDDASTTISYFIGGNVKEPMYSMNESLFNYEGAIKNLNSDFWKRALDLTDVYDFMPTKRREEWNESIRDMTTPDFSVDSVYLTLGDLLNNRSLFLAERVDGIFRNLSGEHVTNRPEGFTKRMIMNYAFDSGDWPTPCSRRAGYLGDLRYVIGKFINRESSEGWSRSYDLMKVCRNRTGIWHEVDGGTLRIKTFKKGTMHIEIDEDIAEKLNEILHFLNPCAIPAKFRTRNDGRTGVDSKPVKKYEVVDNFLPNAVIQALDGGYKRNIHTFEIRNAFNISRTYLSQIYDVLYSIGGTKESSSTFTFDYEYGDVLDDIIISGMLPDKVAYQYYPTPEKVAKQAVLAADINIHDICLEPSAGQGGLVKYMGKETCCVELSSVNVKILESKGYRVEHDDFLEWKSDTKFDKIIMNPPFSQGRAKAHVMKALTHMSDSGRLVAILPSSAKNNLSIDGYDVVWSTQFDNEFDDTSVSVIIAVITKS